VLARGDGTARVPRCPTTLNSHAALQELRKFAISCKINNFLGV
jgi:hypothetical protein